MTDEVAATVPETVSSPKILATQRRHVLIVNGAAVLGVSLLVPWSCFHPPSAIDICLAIVFLYLTMGVGVSVGFHRLLTHRSFRTPYWLRLALSVLGSMAGQGPPTAWVAIHRKHHKYSDHNGDPHSPHVANGATISGLIGFWHAHFGWFLGYQMPNPVYYCPDILKDKAVLFVSRHYLDWVVLGIVAPGVISWAIQGTVAAFVSGVLWGGLARLFVSAHMTWAINSWCHIVGFKAYDTGDESRNSPVLGLFVFGEGWHNNHHKHPSSARFGLRWYQIDVGFWFILGLRSLGLASSVTLPNQSGDSRG